MTKPSPHGERCAAHRLGDGAFSVRCHRKTNLRKEQGKYWCWQHLPSAKEARQEARSKKWEEEAETRDRRRTAEVEVDLARVYLEKLCRELLKLHDASVYFGGDPPPEKTEKFVKKMRRQLKRIDRNLSN